jgi:RNA polymerase sigma factor (sigma-70 family)
MATSQMSVVMQQLRTILERDGAGVSDGELLTRFLKDRDEAALAVLVQRHAGMVWGVCRRLLRSHHDAEDAFQATFLVLVRKASSIVPREMVANWLYGVAHTTAVRLRASAARRGVRERQVADMPEPYAREARDDALLPLLDDELSRLPERFRVMIVLSDLEGKTRKEVARQLAIPEGTVASRLDRARGMLAKRLARHGLSVSGAALAAVLGHQAASASAPAAVVASTIETVSLLAAGCGTARGLTSATVWALEEGVRRTMFLTKLKTMAAVFLVVGAVALAFGLAATGKAQPEAQANAGPKAPSDQPEGQGPRRESPAARAARDDALARCLEATEQIQVDVAKVKVLADLAVLKARAGDAAGARKTLEAAAKLADLQNGKAEEKASGLAQVAYAQARLGQPDTARRTFQRALEVAGTAEHPLLISPGVYGVARALVLTGETERGWEVWHKALRDDPAARGTGALLTTELAGLLAEAGDIPRARECLAF